MLSHTHRTTPLPLNIKIDDKLLTEVQQIKFLGVILDNRLRWKPHIEDTQNKLFKIMGILYKIRNLCNAACLKQLYLSLAYPYLFYCSAIWGGACKTYINSLVIAQKKLLRVITHSNRLAHTHPIFRDLKVLKISDIIAYQTLSFVYKSLNLYKVNNGFKLNTHNISTRRINDLMIPLCKTAHDAQQGILYRGSKIWNDASQDLKALPLNSFKLKIKEKLLKHYS